MPLNDCVKEVKEEIKKESKKDFNDIETINVKAESSLEIFSGYNYDTNEVLNQELACYLVERAETIPLKSKLRIKIFTKIIPLNNIQRIQNNSGMISKKYASSNHTACIFYHRNFLFTMTDVIRGR